MTPLLGQVRKQTQPQSQVAVLLLLTLVTLIGCCGKHRGGLWTRHKAWPGQACGIWADGCGDPWLSEPRELISAADQQHDQEGCVDLYYGAATRAWHVLQASTGTSSGRAKEARQVYNLALEKLIVAGQQHGRLDPREGLRIFLNGEWLFVPVQHDGFLHPPIDFDQLKPMMHYRSKELNHLYRCYAAGVANVVIHHRRNDERFRRDRQEFSATAVLVPVDCQTGQKDGAFVLRLLNPSHFDSIHVGGQSIAITRDLSAPAANLLATRPRNNLRTFIQPGLANRDVGLFTVQPFQPGKIPLVFVHGLFSDPYTWANIANELRARPDLLRRYQVWGFEYPTGEPFLVSAADLREQLVQARQFFDPHGQDAALSRMVLVGHSMGGLLAKLQITCSRDLLWQSVSKLPLTDIVASDAARQRLARAFYFQPSADISRVIYMATPHRGSPWARRPLARLGSKLVEEPEEAVAAHQQLVCDNPGTFSREFERRIPTSIDLLRDDSNLLAAIDVLPVRTTVIENSIIGRYRPMICAGPSDGIVPVKNAVRDSAQTELLIRAKHVQVHRSDDGIGELFRLLRQHAVNCKLPELREIR